MTTTQQTDAEVLYRQACELFAHRHYLDAQVLFDRACALEPENKDFAEGQKRLSLLEFSFFGKGGSPFKNLIGDPAHCLGNGCECCCEACGEGICEAICEGLCEGCDCS